MDQEIKEEIQNTWRQMKKKSQWIGIREGTCCDEHGVLCATNESLNPTSKTNYVLNVG